MLNILDNYRKYLNTFILAGIVLGLLSGLLLPELALGTALIGELFLRLLTLLIVPVIVVSMIAGILNLDDSGNLGRLGLKTIIYYSCTTALAVAVGLLMVNLIQPGKDTASQLAKPPVVEQVEEDATKVKTAGGLADVARKIIPKNIINAALKGNALGLIFFSIFIAIALLSIKHEGVQYIRLSIGALFDAIIFMVDKVMLLAPLGVFSLVAKLVAEFMLEDKLGELGGSIAWYTATVISGLLVHAVISLPLLAVFFKINPLPFFKAVFPAVSTAFSTASSAATLPITIDSLKKRANVPDKIASFVAPLGATVNMDGTAIYEAVAAVFIANMYGVDLSAGEQFIIFITATFSAVGAAGIPGAGLIMMTLVLNAVGLPVEGIQLIVVVDRGLDMLRTSINVWGDSLGAAIIAKSEK